MKIYISGPIRGKSIAEKEGGADSIVKDIHFWS